MRDPRTLIFLDCGAPSIYNKLSRMTQGGGSSTMGSHIRNRKRDNFDYVKTVEYQKYRQGFIDFVKENHHILEIYPNLDVINNAPLTYENQKLLEKEGLHPCPVWHLGSDEEWLRKYIGEGYPYICIGGMVPNSKSVLRPALDRLWRRILTDKKGMPIVKIHGFAMTSFDLMYRYPWFSVDSKSWIDIAKYGGILVPPLKGGSKRDYLHPYKVHFTPRSLGTHASTHHYRTASEGKRRGVVRWLEEIGIPLGKSTFRKVPKKYDLKDGEQWVVEATSTRPGEIEITIEKGVCNTHYMRLDVNLQVYRMIEEIIPEWPWALPNNIKHGKVGLFH